MLVVISGSDFSGKQTQSELLCRRLESQGFSVELASFPRYDTPTGRIIGGPLLGKEHISSGYFPEGASRVPAGVAALYYAADRLYNLPALQQSLKKHEVVILDRYVESNMAHQAGKLATQTERNDMFDWLTQLEYGLCGLPKPDLTIILNVPYQTVKLLRAGRQERADQVERDQNYLISSINAYLELAQKYDYFVVNCAQDDGQMRSIDDVSDEIFQLVIGDLTFWSRIR